MLIITVTEIYKISNIYKYTPKSPICINNVLFAIKIFALETFLKNQTKSFHFERMKEYSIVLVNFVIILLRFISVYNDLTRDIACCARFKILRAQRRN